MGARAVVGWDIDELALGIARRNSVTAGVEVEWRRGTPDQVVGRYDTIVMNPPFGAQRPEADRVFWTAAFTLRPRRLYAFALAASRTFIAARSVAAGVRVELTEPVPWELPRTFRHHRRDRVALPADLWVLAPGAQSDDRDPE